MDNLTEEFDKQHRLDELDSINKLFIWNQTNQRYLNTNLVNLLETQGRKSPNSIAIIFNHESITYKELHKKSNQLAHYLRSKGVTNNTVVAVYLPKSIDLVILLLAILKAGGAYLPIDIKQPLIRVKKILQDSKALLCVLSANSYPLTDISTDVITLNLLTLYAATYSILSLPSINLPDDLSYVIYTSGTTGTPKGVANVHRGTVNRILWMQEQFKLTQKDRVLQKTSISFDVSVWEFWWPLICGAAIILINEGAELNIDEIINYINIHKVTIAHFVPSQLTIYLKAQSFLKCSSLRLVISSGEPLKQSQCNSFFKQSTAELYNLYGPTEASIDVTFFKCQKKSHSPFVPIGKPITNMQAHVLDDKLNYLPIGETGELYLSGPGLAKGYLNNPKLTADYFFHIQSFDGRKIRIYKTGDLVRWQPNGNLEFITRADRQFKLRGFRIEPAEIEAVLTEHPYIEDASVLTKLLSNKKVIIVAFIIKTFKKNIDTISTKDIISFLENRVPSYMIPHMLVWVDQFPLTISGKLDKEALLLQLKKNAKKKIKKPTLSLEKKLTELWQEVLAISPIGIHDNFFSLGGDSLLAMVLTNKAVKYSLSFRSQWLMLYPTISALAQQITNIEKKKNKEALLYLDELPIEPVFTYPKYQKKLTSLLNIEKNSEINVSEIKGIYPATPMQQGILLHTLQIPQSGMYLDQISLNIRGDLDRKIFKQSWALLLDRHDCLRTGFLLTEFSVPQQIIYKECSLRYIYKDLRDYSFDKKRNIIQLYKNNFLKNDFDLKKPPLWEASLFRLEDELYHMIYTEHHSISDGMTQGILFKELFTIYENKLHKKALSLPTPKDFVDYVVWLTNQNQNTAKLYWNHLLQSATETTIMSIDKQAISNGSISNKYHHKIETLTKTEFNLLKDFVRTENISISTVIQAAWVLLLAKYSLENPVIYGLVESGRQIDLADIYERTGPFLQTFPIIVSLDPSTTIKDLLQNLQNQIITSSQYSYYPLDQIKETSSLQNQLDLFRYCITFVNCNASHVTEEYKTFENLSISNFHQDSIMHYPLTAMLIPLNNEITFYFSYNTNNFNENDIKQIFNHWRILLNTFVKNSTALTSAVSMLAKNEEDQLLYRLNHTDRSFPLDKGVIQTFEKQASHTPEKTAILFDNNYLTYAALNKQASQLANYLQNIGATRNSRIIIYLRRGIELIISIIAVLKVRGTYIPIDEQMPVKRIMYILNDSKAELLITHEKLFSQLSSVVPADVIFTISHFENYYLYKFCVKKNILENSNEQLINIIYTSGSTGFPKGVLIKESSLLNLIFSMATILEITSNDTWLALTSISFDISSAEIYLPLLFGGKLVMTDDEDRKNITKIKNLIQHNNVTILQATPSFWRLFLGSDSSISHKIKAITTGEPADSFLLKKLYKKFYRVWNLYGPTETTIWSTFHLLCKKTIEHPTQGTLIGKPIPNTKVYVLDQDKQLAPIGVVGELYIGGKGIACGYLNNPTLTKSKFISHKEIPFKLRENVLYRTGDYVRWLSTGILEYIGRIDEQIKLRGFRIEVSEIEQSILENNFISQAKVIMQKSIDNTSLVAYLVRSKEFINRSLINDQQLHNWRYLYDQIYGQPKYESEHFNIAGWINSFTRNTYSYDEMSEWRDKIIKKIIKLSPRSILEIGCGTGILLFALIKKCQHYYATDLSMTAINYINSKMKDKYYKKNIYLKQCAAHEVNLQPSYDTVIINSVIQYFPDKNYLINLLNKIISSCDTVKQIIIGDVRNLTQLSFYYTKYILSQSVFLENIKTLQSEVHYLSQHEEELIVSPDFFYTFVKDKKNISVEIQLKRGIFETEMNLFRYDVIYHINKTIPEIDPFIWYTWKKILNNASGIKEYLSIQKPKILAIKNIPNAHMSGSNKLLHNSEINTDFSMQNICSSVQKHPFSVFPEILAKEAESIGYEVYLTPGICAETFDAVLYLSEFYNELMIAKRLTIEFSTSLQLSDLTNNPEINIEKKQDIVKLIKDLKEKLPPYMLPNAYVWLDSLPTNISGKLDKEALPLPHKRINHDEIVLPRNDIEENLLKMWKNYTNKVLISVDENLLDQGGNSLLLMRLLASIYTKFEVQLSISDFYELPTIEKLANLIISKKSKEIIHQE